MNDFRVLRDRAASLESAIDRAEPRHRSGAARRLVQITDGGAMPSEPNRVYLAFVVEMGGDELEGSPGFPDVDSGAAMPVVVLGIAPTIGDRLIATMVGGRWCAEKGTSAPIECDWACGPTVTFGDSPTGDTAYGRPVVTGGAITDIDPLLRGSGYASNPPLTFSASGGGGTHATGTARIGGVTGTTITNGGSGYASAPTVTFSAPGGGGVTATGTATIAAGAVTGIVVIDKGSLYTSNPTVTIAAPGGGGTTATATAVAGVGSVTDFTITNGGTLYVDGQPSPDAWDVTLVGNGHSFGPFIMVRSIYSDSNFTCAPGPYPPPISPCVWSHATTIDLPGNDHCPGLSNVPVLFCLINNILTVSLGLDFAPDATSEATCTGTPDTSDPHCPVIGAPHPTYGTHGNVLDFCTSRPYTFTDTWTHVCDSSGVVGNGNPLWYPMFGGTDDDSAAIDFSMTISEHAP